MCVNIDLFIHRYTLCIYSYIGVLEHMCMGRAQAGPGGAAGAALRGQWARPGGQPAQNANSRRTCVRSVRREETLHQSCHIGASG